MGVPQLCGDDPDSPTKAYRRGIDRTDRCPIDRATYDRCIDPLDYG